MRRIAVALVSASLACTTAACSPARVLTGDDTAESSATIAEPTGQMAMSRVFDQPFPYATDTGQATMTVSAVRMETSYVYEDHILVVDVRAVQAEGQPSLDPGFLHAYDPGGEEFTRLDPSDGVVDNPLVPTVMQAPGQEVVGMVAWKMPLGARIGRIDVTVASGVYSLIVTRQPIDPEATTAVTTSSGEGGTGEDGSTGSDTDSAVVSSGTDGASGN